MFDKQVPDAFANSGLERWLHPARHRVAADLRRGQREFGGVHGPQRRQSGLHHLGPEDACYNLRQDRLRRAAPHAEEVHAMAMANLHGEYATVTSTAAMLERLRASGRPARLPPCPSGSVA